MQKQITQKTQKQISYLVFGFIVIFAVSIVLILFERVRYIEELAMAESKPTVSERPVKGATTDRPSVSEYREYTLTAAGMLSSLIDRMLHTETIAYWEAGNVHEALMAITVPDIYKNLHFQLVHLSTLVQSEQADIDNIVDEYEQIRTHYPWIFNELTVP